MATRAPAVIKNKTVCVYLSNLIVNLEQSNSAINQNWFSDAIAPPRQASFNRETRSQDDMSHNYFLRRVYSPVGNVRHKLETLPKAQRTRGLSSTYQNNFFGSYHKFFHQS